MVKVKFFSLFLLLLLTACGGSGTSNKENRNSTGLPDDINGLIVFDRTSSAPGSGSSVVNPAGIFKLRLKKGQVREKKIITSGKSGYQGYAHSSGKIIFIESCGAYGVNHLKIFKENGLVTRPFTPCSNNVKNASTTAFNTSTSYYLSGILSPDQSKIATTIYYRHKNFDKYNYTVIIYDYITHLELKRFVNYAHPTWHPDGRLLISPAGADSDSYGLFLTNKEFTSLHRIDQGLINSDIDSPNIGLSGKQVVFSMRRQIWAIGIDGDNLRELVVGDSVDADLSFPTWSPNEQYIAYLRYRGRHVDDVLMFYSLASSKKYILNTNYLLPPRSGGSSSGISPGGPLSWVK